MKIETAHIIYKIAFNNSQVTCLQMDRAVLIGTH